MKTVALATAVALLAGPTSAILCEFFTLGNCAATTQIGPERQYTVNDRSMVPVPTDPGMEAIRCKLETSEVIETDSGRVVPFIVQ
jgi:hypothetical protein